MDIKAFAYCLKDLISRNEKVEVPGLGLFFASMTPASFSNNKAVINPPQRKMCFQKQTVIATDESLLVDMVSRHMKCSIDQAKTEIQWCIDRLRTELEQTKKCIIPGLGIMKADSVNDYYFVYDETADIYLDGIGFEPVFLKVSEKKKKSSIKWWKVAIISLLVLVIATIVLAYIYKDANQFASQIYSWTDNIINHILYNSEELELLGL